MFVIVPEVTVAVVRVVAVCPGRIVLFWPDSLVVVVVEVVCVVTFDGSACKTDGRNPCTTEMSISPYFAVDRGRSRYTSHTALKTFELVQKI